MKIQEVCEKTGLTKRTIRFYEEKGLIAPKTEDKNGKAFREYDDNDVKRLNAIADLRKLEFSVDEINEMIDTPASIGRLVKDRKAALAKELSSKKEILSVLEQLDEDTSPDIFILTQRAGRSLNKLPVRDIEPDFSKFETLTGDEKQRAVKRFYDTQHKTSLKHRRIKLIVQGLILPLLLMFAVAFAGSFIPQSIDITTNGSYNGEYGPINEAITVKGKIFTPLLLEPFFVGDVTFSKNDSYNTHCEAYIYPDFFDTYTSDGFFYNINKNKTTGHIMYMGDNSMSVYISSELKSITIYLDKDKKEIRDAYIATYKLDWDGVLYEAEEFNFDAAKPSYDEFGYDVYEDISKPIEDMTVNGRTFRFVQYGNAKGMNIAAADKYIGEYADSYNIPEDNLLSEYVGLSGISISKSDKLTGLFKYADEWRIQIDYEDEAMTQPLCQQMIAYDGGMHIMSFSDEQTFKEYYGDFPIGEKNTVFYTYRKYRPNDEYKKYNVGKDTPTVRDDYVYHYITENNSRVIVFSFYSGSDNYTAQQERDYFLSVVDLLTE